MKNTTYKLAGSVLSNFAPDFYESLSRDQIDTLNDAGRDDCLTFTVIDGETLVIADSISGDIYQTETIEEFIKGTAEFLKEVED